MNWRLIFCLACLGAAPSEQAVTILLPGLSHPYGLWLSETGAPPAKLVIGDQVIIIDLKTGEVRTKEPPDDAARAFWEAVRRLAPFSCARP